jgi:hypothetical protein
VTGDGSDPSTLTRSHVKRRPGASSSAWVGVEVAGSVVILSALPYAYAYLMKYRHTEIGTRTRSRKKKN